MHSHRSVDRRRQRSLLSLRTDHLPHARPGRPTPQARSRGRRSTRRPRAGRAGRSPSAAASPGVGATTIACGLARELARLGKQVVLVDANLAAPRHRRLGSPTSDSLSLRHARRRARRHAPRRRSPHRPRAKASASSPGCPPAPPAARPRSRSTASPPSWPPLRRQADVVLLDAGAGMNPWIDRLWQLASQVLLVATPDVDARRSTPTPRSSCRSTTASTASCGSSSTAATTTPTPPACTPASSATCQRFLGHRRSSRPRCCRLRRPPQRRAAPHDAFTRAVRLLAADLAVRLPRRSPLACAVSAARRAVRRDADVRTQPNIHARQLTADRLANEPLASRTLRKNSLNFTQLARPMPITHEVSLGCSPLSNWRDCASFNGHRSFRVARKYAAHHGAGGHDAGAGASAQERRRLRGGGRLGARLDGDPRRGRTASSGADRPAPPSTNPSAPQWNVNSPPLKPHSPRMPQTLSHA